MICHIQIYPLAIKKRNYLRHHMTLFNKLDRVNRHCICRIQHYSNYSYNSKLLYFYPYYEINTEIEKNNFLTIY